MTKKSFATLVKAGRVFFMVLTVAILFAACGKEPIDNWADNGVYAVRSADRPVNGESYDYNSYPTADGAQLDGWWKKTTDAVPTDSAKASATIRAAVELQEAEIKINSTLKNNNVWSFDSISQPVATAEGYRWTGHMTKNDGQKAVFTFESENAFLRDSIIGLEPVAIKSVRTTNTATSGRSGEKERMSTQEFFTATVRETGTGRSNTVDIPLSATYMRYIPENAPEIVDSIIDWTDDLEFRSGLWALENSDKAQIKVIYIMSDGSRVDGPKYTIEAPRTIWGMEDKKYVSEFVQTLSSNFLGQQTTEAEKKDEELSDENWDVYYKTLTGSWEHNQTALDGSKAVTGMSVRQPRFVFHHGKLSHDFGYITLVATPSVELLNKNNTVENGNNFDVKQIKNSFSVKYGVDSTGVQNLSAVSTVDLLKQIIKVVPTSWELLSKTNEFVNWNHIVGAKYRVTYSDGTSKDFDFAKTINGFATASPVITDEEVVEEQVDAPSDYILNKENKQDGEISFAMWKTQVDETTNRSRGSHQYGFTYSIGREVKYVKDFGNGVVVEINFEDPTISHNAEMTDFVQTGEEEVEGGTKETWKRNNNLLVNINGQNNTINNYGVINIFEAAQEVPEAPKAVIGGGIVSPKPGLSDSMWYVGYLIELNNGKVRPLIVDKNGQNVTLGDEFDKNSAWNGAAYINGTLYPVLGSNQGSMLKYTYKVGVSYAISAVNAGDGFNWNHATVENVTGHYKPVIKKQGGKTILTLEGVANWSMSF